MRAAKVMAPANVAAMELINIRDFAHVPVRAPARLPVLRRLAD